MTVITADGAIRGAASDGVERFRGIRYARAERFEPPEEEPAWEGVRDALEEGPMCPQPRFEFDILGLPDPTTPQDEDCLYVSVVRPASAEREPEPLPVMVWFHGGSYVNGVGAGEVYDAARIVRDGNVIVVGVNYRLGIFGYLPVEGHAANLGILDQLEALRWVARNIAGFGSDPANVTVFGESAGADAVAHLLAIVEADGLYQRAIMQSAPLGLDVDREAIGKQLATRFHAELLREDLDPETATVAQLLAAQTTAMSGLVGNRLTAGMPYAPVPGQWPVPAPEALAARWRARASSIDVIIGWNRDDFTPFLDSIPVIRASRALRLTRPITQPLNLALTSRVFAAPALRLARILSEGGAKVHTYRFDWRPQGTPWGACHCIELPFFWATETMWSRSPMLAGVRWRDLEVLGRELRHAWTSFARTGVPEVSPHRRPWAQYSATEPIGVHWSFLGEAAESG